MAWNRTLFVSFCLLLVSGWAPAGFAEQEKIPSIRVQGEGRVEAAPDQATISFGVTSEEKSLEKAYRDNTAKMNAMIETIKQAGIEPKDIQTSSFSVNPVYAHDPQTGRPLKPEGFSVSQQLTVLVRDLAKSGPLIDQIMAGGANMFHGIQFASSRMDALIKEAKVKAAKNAKENAVLLAESLGVQLGKILDVNDEVSRPFPMMEGRMMAMSADMGGAPQIEAGSLEVSAFCNVEFAIVQ